MATRNELKTAPDGVDETTTISFTIDTDDPENPESLAARVRVRVYLQNEKVPFSSRLNAIAGGGTAASPNMLTIYAAALADWGYA